MDESRRVWKPKSSVGGPRHFLSMVWLVRLQPRLYLDDESPGAMVLLLLKWLWIPPWLQPVVASSLSWSDTSPTRSMMLGLCAMVSWGGLVSITAGCGNMECGSAFATGVVGAIVYQAASILLKRLKIDDPVDACPVHCFCGAWGVMASGLFDWGKGIDHYHGWSGFGCTKNDDGSCQTGIGVHALAAQGIMILAIAAWSATTSGFLFYGLKRSGMLAYSDPAEAFESAKLRLRRFVADLGTGLML